MRSLWKRHRNLPKFSLAPVGSRQLSRESLGRTHASRPLSIPRRSTMAKYLISFPSAAMVVPDGELGTVGRDAHAVIDEAKAAGVYVFGGGIDEGVPPVLGSADGAVAMGDRKS